MVENQNQDQVLSPEQITPKSHPELFEKVGVANEQIDTSWVEKIGFWSIVWEQFRKNKFAMAGLYCVALLFIIAIYAPILSSSQPFFCYFKSSESAKEFNRLDINHDKRISRKEFIEAAQDNKNLFATMDANCDGNISEWEWKGKISFPWVIALFDRRISESGVDIFFNLLMVLSPLYLLAWFLIRKRLGKAMSVYFIHVVAGFALVHLLVFSWMMHDGENSKSIPIFFHLAMVVIPAIFLLISINIARKTDSIASILLYALSTILAVHLVFYLWGALATFEIKASQVVAGHNLRSGTGYYSKVFRGGYYGKPTPYYMEFENRISRQKAVLAGHETPVTSVAWSPDGKWIASVDMADEEKKFGKHKIVLRELKDKTIRICDPVNGTKLSPFTGHSKGLTSVAWSPDSKRLITGSKDCSMRLWDVAKHKQLSVFKGHEETITSVAFSPNGDMLASASEDTTVRIWGIANRLSLVLVGHDKAVTSVAFSPDGKMLASASLDCTVRLWDLSGANLVVLKGHGGAVNCVTFSPDHNTLASCSADQTVRLWDVNSKKQLAVFSGHQGEVSYVRFSPDGKRLASAGTDKKILIWNVEKKKLIDTLPNYGKYAHTKAITGISWAPSGNELVSCSLDCQIFTWNVRQELAKTHFLYPLRAFSCNETDTREENPRRPGKKFWLGTNSQGKDVMAIMIYGTRISLTIGVVAVSIYITIGIILGSIAGFSGGKIDLLISRFIEVMLCFPTLFLILTIVVFIKEPNIFHIMVVIGITRWTTTARLVRAEFLRLRNIEYVQAAVALGFKKSRIMFGHVLPNALGPVLVAATFGVAASILIESTLAFLGLGDPSAPSWGLILKQGYTTHKMWLIMAPGLAIFFVVSVLNLVGEGLRDALDPKLRQ